MNQKTPSALIAPFRVRGFLLQWPADLLTNCGIEMEILILGWYILVETKSVLLLMAERPRANVPLLSVVTPV